LKLILGPAAVVDGGLASVGLLLAMLYLHWEALVGGSGWSVAGILFLGAMMLIPCGLLYYAYRLQGHLRRVYSQSLRTLGALLEAKVEGSQPGHGERVSDLAARLAEVLELPPQQVEQLRYAGYLHDIGKVAAPLSLLQGGAGASLPGSGGLRLHPQIGAGILQPVHFLRPAAQMVQCHHERWDGLGYPEGLRQTEIPLGARILALANACVGMTESGIETGQALSRLDQAARSRFDPQLLPALYEALALPY
jgi:HD-GYP domain-containing protein (c-di-GMP phosphodiesterase class II)